MRGKLNIKLYGYYAQLFISKDYVGSIPYTKHEAVEHDGWATHTFFKDDAVIANIDARGGRYGTHFS